MVVRAVFFDLGSTLFYYDSPWPESYHEFADPLLEALRSDCGYQIDYADFHKVFPEKFLLREPNPKDDFREKNSVELLMDVLVALECDLCEQESLKRALRKMYSISETHWQLDEYAVDLLIKLANDGYKIGAISNAADQEDVTIILDNLGLRKHFEVLVTSAGFGYAKPSPRIFRYAMDKIGVTPQESVMVGDSLTYDITGANRAGMKSIWVKRWVKPGGPLPETQGIRPTGTAETLADVYQIISNLK